MRTLIFALLLMAGNLFAQPTPREWINPFTTNRPPQPVFGDNNISISNRIAGAGGGTDWNFYGISPNTVARLIDISNIVSLIGFSNANYVLINNGGSSNQLATNLTAVYSILANAPDDGTSTNLVLQGPVRTSGGTFLSVKNGPSEILNVSSDGGLLIGPSSRFEWGGPALNGNILIAYRDNTRGDADSFRMLVEQDDGTNFGEWSLSGTSLTCVESILSHSGDNSYEVLLDSSALFGRAQLVINNNLVPQFMARSDGYVTNSGDWDIGGDAKIYGSLSALSGIGIAGGGTVSGALKFTDLTASRLAAFSATQTLTNSVYSDADIAALIARIDPSGVVTLNDPFYDVGNAAQINPAWSVSTNINLGIRQASSSQSGVIGITDWNAFNQKTPTNRTITINGTANQITSSAGAQALNANRTWTLSLPNNLNISGVTNQTTEDNAGLTTLYGGLKLPLATAGRIAIFDAASQPTNAPALTAGQYLTWNGSALVASNLPPSSGGTALTVMTNGTIVSTAPTNIDFTVGPSLTLLTTNTSGNVQPHFDTVQGIQTTSTPQFNRLGLGLPADAGIGLLGLGGLMFSNTANANFLSFTNGQMVIGHTNVNGFSNQSPALVISNSYTAPSNTVQEVEIQFVGSTFQTGNLATNVSPVGELKWIPTITATNTANAGTWVLQSRTNQTGPPTTNMTVTSAGAETLPSGGSLTVGSSSVLSSQITSGGEIDVGINSPLHWVNRINVYSPDASSIRLSDSGAISWANIFLGAQSQSNGLIQFIASNTGNSNSTVNFKSANSNVWLHVGMEDVGTHATNCTADTTSFPGYTNTTSYNQIWNVRGTSGNIVFWNRTALAGATACGIAIWTNSVIASGEDIVVGVNCGIAIDTGVSVIGGGRAF